MKVTEIFGQKFTTIQDIKDFARYNGIVPSGRKNLKSTWINAVTGHYIAEARRNLSLDLQLKQQFEQFSDDSISGERILNEWMQSLPQRNNHD